MADHNIWKHVKTGDVSNNPYFKETENIPPTSPSSDIPGTMQVLNGVYEITERFDTYALGVDSIRNTQITLKNLQSQFTKPDGSKIYRPLTTLESLEVMINDYNTLKDENGTDRNIADRTKLFSNYKYTCTGVAYKNGGGEIKIIPESSDLILIPSGFNENSLPITYSKIIGTKLDTSKAKYNKLLSQSEVVVHPAWIASVGDTQHGRDILKAYSDIVFNLLKDKNKTQGMGYWITTNPGSGELRALCVSGIVSDSNAFGSGDLDGGARFLRVARTQKN